MDSRAGHRRAKFVVYPIAPPQADGTQLIDWICDRRLREDGIGGGLTAPSRENWSKPGSLDDLLPTFGGWHFDWLDALVKRYKAAAGHQQRPLAG